MDLKSTFLRLDDPCHVLFMEQLGNGQRAAP